MVERPIIGFHQDSVLDWVAELSCGHTQHVRHRPPFELRPWVTTAQGRSDRLGMSLDCNFCEMPVLPANARAYETTREYDETSIPQVLLRTHTTLPGVWGRILVAEGLLRYQILAPKVQSWVLNPQVTGIIAPGQPHCVSPCGTTRFKLEFLNVTASAAHEKD